MTGVAWLNGKSLRTIEGAASIDDTGRITASAVQKAFLEHFSFQCGYCTPGMVMSAVDLCQRHPQATEAEIREQLEGNLCRCTGYQQIIQAVRLTAKGGVAAAKPA